MRRRVYEWLIAGILLAVCPMAAESKMLDGFALESATTLPRGLWNLKSYLEFTSTAKPLSIPQHLTNSGADIVVKVDSIRLPVEIRYGISENWEAGGDLGFESDDGEPDGAATYFDGSGLQRMRFFGKWNFLPDMAAMADLAFLGDNTLYYSLDSFDFGLKFMYGPQMGAGTLNLNMGFLIKGGSANFNGGNSKIKSSDMGYRGIVPTYGIGYVYPYSDQFTGIFEMAGGSSPLKGGSGIGSKSALSFFMGGRYGFTELFNLDGGFGIGLGKGSPRFLLKIGMDWQWGPAGGGTSSSESSSRWSPTSEPREARKPEPPAPSKSSTPEPPKREGEMEKAKSEKATSYYEPPPQPPQYESPKPPAAPIPAGPSPEELFQTHVAAATSAFNQTDYSTAVTEYEAAVKIRENDATLQYNLATAYFQLKRYADAKTYYKNAITLKPSDPDSHLYLGYTYYYLQDQASATQEWKRVLEIDPANSLARENLKAMGAAE